MHVAIQAFPMNQRKNNIDAFVRLILPLAERVFGALDSSKFHNARVSIRQML